MAETQPLGSVTKKETVNGQGQRLQQALSHGGCAELPQVKQTEAVDCLLSTSLPAAHASRSAVDQE